MPLEKWADLVALSYLIHLYCMAGMTVWSALVPSALLALNSGSNRPRGAPEAHRRQAGPWWLPVRQSRPLVPQFSSVPNARLCISHVPSKTTHSQALPQPVGT